MKATDASRYTIPDWEVEDFPTTRFITMVMERKLVVDCGSYVCRETALCDSMHKFRSAVGCRFGGFSATFANLGAWRGEQRHQHHGTPVMRLR